MRKTSLLITCAAMIGIWVVFKCFYPYADFFSDSYSYIQAAAMRDAIDYRPIGYAIFLRLVHAVTHSDTFLVTLQYVLVQGAGLALFVTLKRRFGIAVWAERLILVFLVVNPVIPYTCNYVSSDALFIALSLIWFNVLIGLILQPSWRGLIIQLVLLAMIFNIRYIALFYPAVAAIAFFLMRKDWWFRIIGIGASVVIVALGMMVVKSITRKHTGANIFSAFSGWQIANNALHLYPWLPVDTTAMPSAECTVLAEYVKDYFADTGAAIRLKEPAATTAYMWERSSPLHRYRTDYQNKHSLSYFTAWNRVGVVFTDYGYHLVRKHPLDYGRYYIWPSAQSFFVTPLDVYAVYNEGKRQVDVVAKDWFDYPSQVPKVSSPTFQGKLLAPLPYIYLFLNLAFVVTAVLLLGVGRNRRLDPRFTLCFRLAAAYLLANAVFCIVASPTVFRYQVLPVLLLFIFTVFAAATITRPPSEPHMGR